MASSTVRETMSNEYVRRSDSLPSLGVFGKVREDSSIVGVSRELSELVCPRSRAISLAFASNKSSQAEVKKSNFCTTPKPFALLSLLFTFSGVASFVFICKVSGDNICRWLPSYKRNLVPSPIVSSGLASA